MHHRLLLDSHINNANLLTILNKYLVLMVEKFLHAFFLAVFECGVANLVHDEENGLIPVPQVLLHQYPDPELQHGCDTDATQLRALGNVTLENRSARGKCIEPVVRMSYCCTYNKSLIQVDNM